MKKEIRMIERSVFYPKTLSINNQLPLCEGYREVNITQLSIGIVAINVTDGYRATSITMYAKKYKDIKKYVNMFLKPRIEE